MVWVCIFLLKNEVVPDGAQHDRISQVGLNPPWDQSEFGLTDRLLAGNIKYRKIDSCVSKCTTADHFISFRERD